MCGIAGIIGARGSGIHGVLAAMRHRGPDDHGVFSDERIVLGMTRLAIIDTSSAGHQPMSTDDGGIWIVYNGETYNFLEERAILEAAGVRFRSHSDTEVLLRLYERHGDSFLTRLRGMFALAIYDRRGGKGSERLLLARDPLGIKPLLYAKVDEGLIFASEMKALLASNLIAAELDADSLRLLLTFGSIPQPLTAIRGVKMLPAGHRLVLEQGAQSLEPYWRLVTNRVPEVQNGTYQDQVQAVRHAVSESLSLQLVSDVPLGAFLSGGIDSSILVALMAKHASGRVKTFSIGFESDKGVADESADAQLTADFLGTEHHRAEVTGRLVRDRILDFASALDQPSMNGVNAFFVSLATCTHVTVAISGTGGDELFAGYPWFGEMNGFARTQASGSVSGLLGKFARSPSFDALMTSRLGGRFETIRSKGAFLPHFARLHQAFGAPLALRLLAPSIRGIVASGRDPSWDCIGQDELPDAAPVSRVTALCLRGYTQNQLLRDIDAVSMANSLEVRVPLLDHRLVDLALSLPDTTKLNPTATALAFDQSYRVSGAKRVLIDAFRDVLPPNLDARPKRGFGMPIAAWLRHELRDVMDDAMSPSSVRRRGLLDPDEVEKVRARFNQGTAPWTHPWILTIFELWCREVLDKSVAPASM